MTAPILTAQVTGPGTISVDIASVPPDEAIALIVRLGPLLRQVGTSWNDGAVTDEIHVMTQGEDPALAIAHLIELCAAEGIEVRDITPVAPEDAPTQPRAESVIVTDEDTW